MDSPLRVLILEDSATDAALLIERLRVAGYQADARVVEARRGYLAALKSAPDVVLADYRLPKFNGLEALRLLQARGVPGRGVHRIAAIPMSSSCSYPARERGTKSVP